MSEKKRKEKRRNYLLFLGTIYFIVVYFTLHYVSYFNAYDHSLEKAFSEGTSGLSNPFYFPGSLSGSFFGIFAISLITLMVILLEYTKQKLREGIKHEATSHWNDDQGGYDKTYKDPENKRNMCLSKHIFLSMDTRKTRRNCNIVVIGGSGSGKSRFFVKPNLCEMAINTSYICTDPAGELVAETGTMLEANGYKIKVFNLVDIEKSDNYNPLDYLHTETDVILVTDCILKNTTDPNAKGGDAFWEKAQSLLLQAIIFLLWQHGDELHLPKNMDSVVRLISGFQVSEEGDTSDDEFDESSSYFEAIGKYGWYFDENGAFHIAKGKKAPEGYEYHEAYGEMDMGYRQYKGFKMGAGKTLKSILISADARLATLKIPTIANLLSHDTLELSKIGDEKTALFIVIPAENESFNFIAAMLYTQLFQALYFHAGNDCLGSFNIYDSKGEHVKTFFTPQIEEEEEEESAEEINIDFNTGAEQPSEKEESEDLQKSSKKHFLFKKKNREVEKVGTVNAEGISEMNADPGKIYEKQDKAEEQVKLEDNEDLENQVKLYVEATKNVKLTKIGHKYLVKIPINNEDEVIGVYTNEARAIERCKAIKNGCTYKRNKSPSLPYHCRFMLDEFANIGQIPDFTKKLATMRKHEISCSIILQNMAQIKTMYKDDWGSVMGNCDSLLFLGCPEVDTLEYISKLLGNEEIKTTSNSISSGKSGSQSESISKKTKPLMSVDELHRMDNNKCIFILRGEFPFFDDKCTFDESIKNYEFTADANEKNTYIIKKKHISHTAEETSFGKKSNSPGILEEGKSDSSSYYSQENVASPQAKLSTARIINSFEKEPDNLQNVSNLLTSLLKNCADSEMFGNIIESNRQEEEKEEDNNISAGKENDDSNTINSSLFG